MQGEKGTIIIIMFCILEKENEDVCSAPIYIASSRIFICLRHNQMLKDE